MSHPKDITYTLKHKDDKALMTSAIILHLCYISCFNELIRVAQVEAKERTVSYSRQREILLECHDRMMKRVTDMLEGIVVRAIRNKYWRFSQTRIPVGQTRMTLGISPVTFLTAGKAGQMNRMSVVVVPDDLSHDPESGLPSGNEFTVTLQWFDEE